jgi:hypothetical protein
MSKTNPRDSKKRKKRVDPRIGVPYTGVKEIHS